MSGVDAGELLLENPPPPKLSLVRVLIALALVAGIAGSGAYAIERHAAGALRTPAARFAPYVDVTLTPTYSFQNPTTNPVQRVVLGFVVADRAKSCAPSWGGYYSPSQAESALNLDQRVTQVQAQGGVATVSFGGQAGTELAVSCADVPRLAATYMDVLHRYGVSDADFDVEGSALEDPAANQRRAEALARVQHRFAATGRRLRVWLTLPAVPHGLTPAGVGAVRAMLAGGVVLTGVNLLAMDFTPTHAVQNDIIGAVESALAHAHEQLTALDAQVRIDHRSAAVWGQLGVTVMIGRNDTAGETFTLGDARALASFVEEHGIAQISTWSLNRDTECGSVFAEVGVLSNLCSGVKQAPLAFTRIFSKLPGTVTAASQAASALPSTGSVSTDDPSSSPYPVWRPDAAYPGGYKVVWHHAVYQALWFAQAQAPDAPVSGQGQTPWLLLGPVLAGESAPKPILADRTVHVTWSPRAVYRAGARVRYQGLPFVAKWYSQSVVPETNLPASSQSPWSPLFTIAGEPGT